MINDLCNKIDTTVNKHFTLKNFITFLLIAGIINIVLGIYMDSTPFPG